MQDVSQGQGRTVLFVSHNMASIQNLCQRVVLLENGSIKAVGETKEMIELYLKANATISDEEIAKRTDRAGDQSLKIIDFWIETSNHKKIDTITSGADINIVLKLKNNNAKGKVDVGIGITNSSDFTLSIIYSSYQGVLYEVDENDQTLLVKYNIEKFPYTPGKYKIVARILRDGKEADWPNNGIGDMLVEKGDFYGTGNFGEMGVGPVLIDGSWG